MRKVAKSHKTTTTSSKKRIPNKVGTVKTAKKYSAKAAVKRVASSSGKSKKSSGILSAVHETASGLHLIGVIDKQTMREFDSLCLPEIPDYTPDEIREIRTRNRASQAVFAKYMNVTASSLQKWEIGAKRPSGVALKLLNLVDRKGLDALL